MMGLERLDSVVIFYGQTVESYESLLLSVQDNRTPQELMPSFLMGLTPIDLNQVMIELQRELNREVVLTIVAITEDEIRTHYQGPGQKKIKGLKRIFKKTKRHARLDDLLDEWKVLLPTARVVSQFKQVLDYRHWLAHGRSRSRRPQEFTPLEASERSRALLIEILGYR